MHPDVSIDKIGYMMNRLGGDDEITVDDLEAFITKVFVCSFEQEHGFEAALVRELLNARDDLIAFESEDDTSPDHIDRDKVEGLYLQYQKDMYAQAGFDPGYAEESVSWPEALPLDAAWDKKMLRTLARKEVAHHLVVVDQLREEMAKRTE